MCKKIELLLTGFWWPWNKVLLTIIALSYILTHQSKNYIFLQKRTDLSAWNKSVKKRPMLRRSILVATLRKISQFSSAHSGLIDNLFVQAHIENIRNFDKKEGICPQGTNLSNRGLISEDRSSKATLLFTIPRSCLSRLHRIYLWKF